MRESIKEGDIVDVFWTKENCRMSGVRVLHVAVQSGDLWHVADDSGNITAFNPSCGTFEAIVKKGSAKP